MNGKDMNRAISIMQPIKSKDPVLKSQVTTWIPFADKVPANVQDILPSKSESTQTSLRMEKRPARIRTRYRDGVTADMRIVIHGEVERTTEIISGPVEIGRRRWMEFMVEEYSS